MVSLADVDDEEGNDDVTAAAQQPHHQPRHQPDETAPHRKQQQDWESHPEPSNLNMNRYDSPPPQQQQQQQQQLQRVRPLVIREVMTAKRGKGRIKPRRAQLEACGANDGANILANIPRIDGEYDEGDSSPPPRLHPSRHIYFFYTCLLYTSPSPRDATLSRMPSSA